MKPAMVMEKVDVSVETVNTNGGKQGDRMATKLGLWRPHRGPDCNITPASQTLQIFGKRPIQLRIQYI